MTTRSAFTLPSVRALLLARALLPAALALPLLAACAGVETTTYHGFLLDQAQLEQVPQGASRDQVLLALGSPSTTNTFESGNETYYYVSQRLERPVAFMNPRITEQRVVVVTFDGNDTVQNVAEYGLKDGQVFQFSGRTTPTTGKEQSFVAQLISGLAASPF